MIKRTLGLSALFLILAAPVFAGAAEDPPLPAAKVQARTPRADDTNEFLDHLPPCPLFRYKDPGLQLTPTPEPLEPGQEGKDFVPLSDYFFPLQKGRKWQYEALEAKQWQGEPLRKIIECKQKDVSPDGVVRAVFEVDYILDPEKEGVPYLETYLVYPTKVVHLSSECLRPPVAGLQPVMHWRDSVDLALPHTDKVMTWTKPGQGKQTGSTRRLAAYFGTCETHNHDYKDCLIVEEWTEEEAEGPGLMVRYCYARHEGLVRTEWVRLDDKGKPVQIVRWLTNELMN